MPRRGTGAGGRPVMDESGNKKMISVRLSPRHQEKLKEIAKARGIPIVRVIEDWIDQEGMP